jgi:hypothetical protein
VRCIYSSFDLIAVYHARNLLEASGIATLVRNEILSSGAGELPPAECQVELWVRRDSDAERARTLLRHGAAPASGSRGSWRCPQCGEDCEPQFTHCWNCGGCAPAPAA